MNRRSFFPSATFASLLLTVCPLPAQPAKPVLLYSRTWNAAGEARYQPDGTYSGILARMKKSFDVKIGSGPVTSASLAGVAVILIANPSDKAVEGHPAPRHVVAEDRAILTDFVKKGGGLILMGNQENHNLETVETNLLLADFGMKWEDRYTDIKGLVIPAATPIIGGLKWGYYSGNTLVLNPNHPSKPRALVPNDVAVTPLNSTRNEPGVLLGTATSGSGRVVVATDAGWIGNAVLEGKGIGGFAVPGDDNVEIFRRLASWAGGGHGK